MSRLFNRDYSLSIVTVDGLVKTLTGLRIKFEVSKSLISFPNSAKIELFNCNDDTLSMLSERNTKVFLNVGYQDDIGLIFSGDVKNVFQYRQPPDTSVVIYAGDSQLKHRNTTFNRTMSENVTIKSIITQLAESFGFDVDDSNLPSLDDKKLGGQTLSGKAADLLDQFATQFNFDWTMQDDSILLLADESVLPGEITIVSVDTGLIGSPTLTELGVDVTAYINHRVTLGSTMRIKSNNVNVALPNLQQRAFTRRSAAGDYKVLKLDYRGDTKRDASGLWSVTVTGRYIT